MNPKRTTCSFSCRNKWCSKVYPNYAHKNKLHSEQSKQLMSINISENAKNNPNYGMRGKHHSISSKLEMNKSHKGLHHTEEAKLKISINNARYWKGKKRSSDTANKIASKNRISWNQRKSLMNGLSFKYPTVSKSEAVFGDKILQIFNISLQPSFWLDGRCFDYKIPNKNILIECDSTYWHSKPDRVEIDKLKNEIAKKHGYELIRFLINGAEEVDRVIEENKEKIQSILRN
jgi:very-short-patch-repair endonuclease